MVQLHLESRTSLLTPNAVLACLLERDLVFFKGPEELGHNIPWFFIGRTVDVKWTLVDRKW